MDGAPHLSGEVLPGGSLACEFVATEAGTHAYHCHFQTIVHLDMGMYGALIVEEPGEKPVWSQEHTLSPDGWDSHHDSAPLPYTSHYDEFLVNGKAFPLIPPLKILMGETHLVRLLNLRTQPQRLHLHGTSFLMVAKDGHALPLPYLADTLPILSGERSRPRHDGPSREFPWSSDPGTAVQALKGRRLSLGTHETACSSLAGVGGGTQDAYASRQFF